MWRQAGKLVPEQIKDDELKALAQRPTKSSRKKYLKYLALKEGHKKANKERRQRKRAEKEASLEKRRLESEGDDQSPKVKNSFIRQYWSRSLDTLLGWSCAQAMIFGLPLVIDMSYESNMCRREVENTVSQLMIMEGENRRVTEPFHLHYCNLQPDGAYKQELLKQYGAEAWDRLLITSTDRQHVDVFPRERLVYLTADSPNVLRTFDRTKVYIIGALVDRSITVCVSLAQAKRLKLATARLPLDEFLCWGAGAKNLTLDQMARILLALKNTGNWEEALKFVPQRKHYGFVQQQTPKQVTQIRRKGVTYPGRRQDRPGSLSFGERNGSSTFESGEKSFSNSQRNSGFTGFTRERSRDREGLHDGEPGHGPVVARTRTSLKTEIEERSASRNKAAWWDDEQ